MSTRGIDTGTGLNDDAGPKMPDLRNVRSEPPPQTKPRRGSFLDTVKEALKPGDLRTGKASPGAWEGQLLETTPKPNKQSTSSSQQTRGWYTIPGTRHQPPRHEEDGAKLFDAPLSAPEHHHARERHRSHGVMDHLLGRRRAHDDPSGIIGSHWERAELSTTKSSGPGILGEDQSYTFDVPRGSKEDPKRSAVDAVPRTSALDMDEAMMHEYATRDPVKGMSKNTGAQQSKNATSFSQYLTDSGLYE